MMEQLHKGQEISASWKPKQKKGTGRGGIGIQTTAPARAQQEPHKEAPAVLSPDGSPGAAWGPGKKHNSDHQKSNI